MNQKVIDNSISKFLLNEACHAGVEWVESVLVAQAGAEHFFNQVHHVSLFLPLLQIISPGN